MEKASLREVPFDYLKLSPDEETRRSTIAQLREIQPRQLVTTEGRLYKDNASLKSVFINGAHIQCLENCLLVDDTGSFPVTIWADQINSTLDEQCYTVTNLRIKAFQGVKHLSTTPSTVFQDVSTDYPQVRFFVYQSHLPLNNKINSNISPQLEVEQRASLLLGLVTVTVTGINMAENYHSWAICKKCNKALTEMLDEKMVRCKNCGAAQQPTTCNTGHSIRLNIADTDNQSKWLTAFEEIIDVLLTHYNESQETNVTLQSTDDEIYELMLSLGTMTIKYHTLTDTIKSVNIVGAE